MDLLAPPNNKTVVDALQSVLKRADVLKDEFFAASGCEGATCNNMHDILSDFKEFSTQMK